VYLHIRAGCQPDAFVQSGPALGRSVIGYEYFLVHVLLLALAHHPRRQQCQREDRGDYPEAIVKSEYLHLRQQLVHGNRSSLTRIKAMLVAYQPPFQKNREDIHPHSPAQLPCEVNGGGSVCKIASV